MLSARTPSPALHRVMPGLVPGIHVLPDLKCSQVLHRVDAHGASPWTAGPRVKPGHDDHKYCFQYGEEKIYSYVRG